MDQKTPGSLRDDLNRMAVQKFAIGQPVTRKEDPTLVTGRGQYTDDVNLPGQAVCVMLRSPHAHGIIRRLDTARAVAMPGVLAIYTAADLAAYQPLPVAMRPTSRDGSPMRVPARHALAEDRVRFGGDPVAAIVAETAYQARDAAEAIELEIEPLPAVTDARAAAQDGAPQLYDDIPGNMALDFHFGDSEKVAAAFAQAAHVTRASLVNNRVYVAAMEPRAAVAQFDPANGRFTIHYGCQGVFGNRNALAAMMNLGPDQLRVVSRNVGGSFGMKGPGYPEYVCVLHAARELGRPVKWTDDRSGSFVSDSQGRDHDVVGELALDSVGRFLALRISGYTNLGAYIGQMAAGVATANIVKNIQSVYRTPLLEVSTRSMLTNTTVISSYRGAGRPEGNYYVERLIDLAADEMGIDKLELRRRNHIKARELPFRTAADSTYDSGDFPGLLKHAADFADIKGFRQRKRDSRKHGRLRGLGIGSFLEVTAPAGKELGGIAFNADGTVTIRTGTLDFGMGHATPFAQVLSAQLGVPFEKINLMQTDSDEIPVGGGSGGSKSIMASGKAIVDSSAKVVEQGKAIAAHVLEADTADIEFAKGAFTIAGTDRSIGIMELAARLHGGLTLPPDLPQSLDVSHVTDTPVSTYPNGCHIAEVEIDPETGKVDVVRYAAVNDFGIVINPLIVEGQVHGGVVQAIGQAIMENVQYDGDGQLLTGSYMDYALPRANDAPSIRTSDYPVPATTNPLGVKGCGEAGCAGGLTSVTNAIVDALSEYGIRNIEMPATPYRVWQAIRNAAAAETEPPRVS